MVEDTHTLDRMFHAMADATRRHMIRQLSQGERSVGDLASPFAMSLAAASKHIKVLESAGLIERRIVGRTHLCRLDARPLLGAVEWLRHFEGFWNERLDALETALRADR